MGGKRGYFLCVSLMFIAISNTVIHAADVRQNRYTVYLYIRNVGTNVTLSNGDSLIA